MQLLQGDLFKDFPEPEVRDSPRRRGRAVPWGRYRARAGQKKPALGEHLLKNVFFDTCVYHYPGIEPGDWVVPVDNLLFASEMLGAVKGIDPETGFHFDDTKRYVEQVKALGDEERYKIFEGNARRVYPRLDRRLAKRGKPGRK
jgi:4-oxalmesaconate hydratase